MLQKHSLAFFAKSMTGSDVALIRLDQNKAYILRCNKSEGSIQALQTTFQWHSSIFSFRQMGYGDIIYFKFKDL
ncbi:MAG: hypothetical protein V4495_16920 [Pseudomonadota bacterium]